MLKGIFLWVRAHFLCFRSACLASTVRVNLTTRINRLKGVCLGEHARLYWGGDVLLGERGFFRVGKRSHLAPYHYCLIADNRLEIGDNVAIGPCCMFSCHGNGIPEASIDVSFSDYYVDGDIRIGDNVLIGAVIKDNVVVGAGSMVKGQLESGWLYAGIPALKVKPLC